MTARPKILLAISSLHRGGAERQLVELVARIDRDRYDPMLALCDTTDEFGVALPPERVFDLRSARGSTPLTLARLARILLRERPAVTHTFGGMLNLYGRMAVRATGVGASLSAVRAGVPYPRDLRNEARTWRWTDAIVANSVGIRDVLVERASIPEARVSVIENGVDHLHFAPAADREKLRAELGMRGTVVVLPARLSEEKNQLGAVDAIAQLRREGRLPADFSLWLVGRVDQGPLARTLREHVAAADAFDALKLRGATQEMHKILAAADATLLPSHFEGMPNVVLESLSCATPAVVSPPANRDAIVRDGVHGLVLDGTSPEDVARGLLRVASLTRSDRYAMGAAGREHILSTFTLDRMVTRTCAVYDALIAKRGPGR